MKGSESTKAFSQPSFSAFDVGSEHDFRLFVSAVRLSLGA